MLTNSNILNFNHSILTTETLNKIRNSQKQKLKKKIEKKEVSQKLWLQGILSYIKLHHFEKKCPWVITEVLKPSLPNFIFPRSYSMEFLFFGF